ncbi:MAG TPA: T9SS type A sorting domain-containing protein [Bacteroidia bacterium]|nr:T9SS type A sorting domain-containing protein [Bacteroidia bacterium]
MSKRNIFPFLVFLFSSVVLKAQIINTIAGNGVAGFSGDGAAATAAELNAPTDVALDASGNLYIVDKFNQRIRKINNAGVMSTVAGNGTASYGGDGGSATVAKLNYPQGIAIDSSGNIFIADAFNNRIRKVNTSGIISTVAGNGTAGYSGDGGAATAAELYQPAEVALDALGNIYVADFHNCCIRKINTLGVISTIAGTGAAGFSGDGGAATIAQLNYPEGMVVDVSGNLFIADYQNNRIRKVDTAGIISTVVGTGGAGFSGDGGSAIAAKLNGPFGLAIDTSGNLYIADQKNSRIRKVNTSGIINTLAGDSVAGYSGDGGLAASAELNYPVGLAIDTLGSIYIADNNNFRIRKITAGAPLVIKEFNDNMETSIYPIPNNGNFNLQIRNSKFQMKKMEIYNSLRERIYSQVLRQVQGDYQIDLSNQPAGIYLYRVTTENGELVGSGKLVIQ